MFASCSEWKTWNQTPVYSCPLKASLLPMFWPVHPSLTLASPCLAQGVLHTVAGYLLYTSLTFKCVFDYHPGDVYWCTADIGWITGHSYVTYGPLANGATSVLVSFFFPCLCSGRGISKGACASSVLLFCFKSRVSVFFPSLKVFRSTLTSAASGRSLRSIKSPSSTQHPQPSACSWSMDVNLCRSKSPFPPLGAFAVQWNPDIQEVWLSDHSLTSWRLSFLPVLFIV